MEGGPVVTRLSLCVCQVEELLAMAEVADEWKVDPVLRQACAPVAREACADVESSE